MTDTTTLAPTDAEILDAAEDFRSQYTHGGTTFDEFDEIGFVRAILAKWGAPAPQGDVAAWLVLADGEPHHVTPGASDDAARLWAEDQTKCGAPYSFTFLPLCPPAALAQQAAPAINKVSDIIDAYGMTPGQPERVADIPGLAEALEAAFADGSAQVTGAAQAAPAPVAEDADPLQGAANWLVTSHATTSATELGGRLCIGYNRAERLFNAARAQAAQPEGGAKP